MPSFEQGDVVRVPFPYTDRASRQHRPALVVSKGAIGDRDALVWVVMITSAENRGWPGDIALGDDHARSGLPAPSIIRTSKIATVEAHHIEALGRIGPERLAEVLTTLSGYLGLQPQYSTAL